MSMDMVLAALEEYFEMKRGLTVLDNDPNIEEARGRAGKMLNHYIQNCFDSAMLEERRRTSSATRKVVVPNPESADFKWDDIAKLIDALNCPPGPLSSKQLQDQSLRDRWMKIYSEWYRDKRQEAMRSISPPIGLELDLEDDLLK